MNEPELDQQIQEGQAVIARAQKLVAENKALYEEAGVGSDLFADVLNSDNFTQEFKDIVKAERAKAVAKIEDQVRQHAPGKSSKIAVNKNATKI